MEVTPLLEKRVSVSLRSFLVVSSATKDLGAIVAWSKKGSVVEVEREQLAREAGGGTVRLGNIVFGVARIGVTEANGGLPGGDAAIPAKIVGQSDRADFKVGAGFGEVDFLHPSGLGRSEGNGEKEGE